VVRKRKPLDFFNIRADLNFGVGRKILDNIAGYGVLFGKNTHVRKLSLLIGGFQYYDFWDNKIFEKGTIGFGCGVIAKWQLSKKSNFYTKIHLALVPFGGSSVRLDPDTLLIRDYNFGMGLQGKFECTFNLSKYGTASMQYYFYMISTYVGMTGNNFVHILKPRITIRIYKMLNLGFENFLYYNNQYLRDYPAIHSVRTEQKIFLLIYLEDRQRRGHYH
jgi:hypothetical protein